MGGKEGMGKLQHSHRGVAGGRAPCCPRCSQLGGQAGTSLPAAHRTPLSPNPISARLIASVSDSCWGTKHGFPSLLPQCFAGEHSGRMLPVERESTALHKQPAVQTLALQAPSSVGPRQQRGSAALGSACASTKHLPRCFQSTFGTDVAAGRPGHCSPLMQCQTGRDGRAGSPRGGEGLLLSAGLWEDPQSTAANGLAESMGQDSCLSWLHPVSSSTAGVGQLRGQQHSVSASCSRRAAQRAAHVGASCTVSS